MEIIRGLKKKYYCCYIRWISRASSATPLKLLIEWFKLVWLSRLSEIIFRLHRNSTLDTSSSHNCREWLMDLRRLSLAASFLCLYVSRQEKVRWPLSWWAVYQARAIYLVCFFISQTFIRTSAAMAKGHRLDHSFAYPGWCDRGRKLTFWAYQLRKPAHPHPPGMAMTSVMAQQANISWSLTSWTGRQLTACLVAGLVEIFHRSTMPSACICGTGAQRICTGHSSITIILLSWSTNRACTVDGESYHFTLIRLYMLGDCRRNGAYLNLGIAISAAKSLGCHQPEAAFSQS